MTRTAQVEITAANCLESKKTTHRFLCRNYSINQNNIALGGLESNQSKAFGERPSTFDNHLGMNFMKKCHESRLQSKLKNPDFDAIVTTNYEVASELPENYLQKQYP